MIAACSSLRPKSRRGARASWMAPVLLGADRFTLLIIGMYSGGMMCGAFGSTVVVVVGAALAGAVVAVVVGCGATVVVGSGAAGVVVVVGAGAVVDVGGAVVVGGAWANAADEPPTNAAST